MVYPDGSSGVEAARQLIADMWRGVSFPDRMDGASPAASGIRSDSTRSLEAFAVTHVPPEPALGYRVVETRRRLKPEFASLPRPRSNGSRGRTAATT